MSWHDDSKLDLRKWIIKHRYDIKFNTPKDGRSASDIKYTHIFLNGERGGLIAIPDSENADFITKYATDISNGKIHYISEQRSDVYGMHADIDLEILKTQSMEEKDIIEYVVIFQKCIKRFYPGLSDKKLKPLLRCSVYLAEVQEKKVVNGLSILKIGIHLYFGELLVDNHIARMIRKAVISMFYLTYGERDSILDNTWEDVIDERIYISNGLRMPFSNKCSNCEYCGNKKEERPNCFRCESTGKHDDGRPYKPKFVLEGSGEKNKQATDLITTNIEVAVTLGSIRRSAQTALTPGFTVYEGAEQYVPEKDMELIARKQKKIPQTNILKGAFLDDIKVSSAADANFLTINPQHQQFKELLKYVRTSFNPDKYKNLFAKKLSCNEAKDKYWLWVGGEGSQYCANVNRDHRGNSIYFYITRDGISQKCCCRCEKTEGRLHGKCKSYQSDKVTLPAELKSILFEDTGVGAFEMLRNPFDARNPADWDRATLSQLAYSKNLIARTEMHLPAKRKLQEHSSAVESVQDKNLQTTQNSKKRKQQHP